MATRSPHNDRYKVEQKGKTRKSASSAKPKRVLGDLTPASATKKVAAKKSRWGRGPATQPMPAFEPTPKMKQLRKIWWMLWGLSLVIAVGILVLQNAAKATPGLESYVPFAWGLWAASMGGAFYLEFSPIRKARMEAMEASRSGHKKSKSDSHAKPVKTPATKADTAVRGDMDEDSAPSPEDM